MSGENQIKDQIKIQSKTEIYDRFYNSENLNLDAKQQDILTVLDKTATLINLTKNYQYPSPDFFTKPVDFIRKLISTKIKSPVKSDKVKSDKARSAEFNIDYRGIYLYGGVGCGKTMLMNRFFVKVQAAKELLHYQNFMKLLHGQLHEIESGHELIAGNQEAVQKLAGEIAARVKVICIDEFEIQDIADAMLIMYLFEYLATAGVFIFLTTNTSPENLYKDGLQRELFLPFIRILQDNFLVLSLNNNHDYRLDSQAGSIMQRILYPLNEENHSRINMIVNSLCPDGHFISGCINLFGRLVSFTRTYNNILITDFPELLMQDFSYADYVHICSRYKIIVLENIPCIKEDATDLIIRFINFVDNAYFYKILLFATMAAPVEEIYPKGVRLPEFQRTVSRLKEMNSKTYPTAGITVNKE